MAAIVGVPWSQILNRVEASLAMFPERTPGSTLVVSSSSDAANIGNISSKTIITGEYTSGTDNGSFVRFVTGPEAVDPNGTPNYNDAVGVVQAQSSPADMQHERLTEKWSSHRAVVMQLMQELKDTRLLLRAAELHAYEVEVQADLRIRKIQASADAQVQEVRAEAEERFEAIRVGMTRWIERADEQLRIATLRASTAERWLHRIEIAASNLQDGSSATATARHERL